MGLFEGIQGLLLVLVVVMVFVSITNVLLPTIVGDSGSTVGMVINMMVVVIVAGGLFAFMRSMMGSDDHADIQQQQF